MTLMNIAFVVQKNNPIFHQKCLSYGPLVGRNGKVQRKGPFSLSSMNRSKVFA